MPNDLSVSDDPVTALMQAALDGKCEEAEKAGLQLPQVECPVYHHFGPGIYIREVWIPKGTLVVGHAHKSAHMNMMLVGKLKLFMEGSSQIVEAPFRLVAAAGRKIAYALENTIWQNIYATDETDIQKLEEMLFEKTEVWEAADLARRTSLLLGESDYIKMLSDIGMTAEQVRTISEETHDLIPFPSWVSKVKVGKSAIEGLGLFATAPIGEGEFIAPARLMDKRTPAGRYTNHSSNPNAKAVKVRGDVMFVSLRHIHGCMGGFDGEEITVDYRQALEAGREQ